MHGERPVVWRGLQGAPAANHSIPGMPVAAAAGACSRQQRLQRRQHGWPTTLPARLLLRFDGHQQESGLLQLISEPHQQEPQKPQSVDF